MRWSEIYEEGAVGVVANNKKQAKDPRYSMSMTNDVKPGETQRQAAKFGNKLDKKGHPPTLSKKVKGASTNVAFNLGMAEDRFTPMELAIMEGGHSIEERFSLKSKAYKKSLGAAKASGRRRKRKLSTKFSEGYKLQLERDPNMYVLHITDTASGKRTEVRGKSGYESGNYDANDKLHQLLDKVGKSANVSELINGEVVSINPKHPDAKKAKAATDVAHNENFADGKVKGKSRPGRVKKSGASCKGSVTKLRKQAKKASGERAKMYHWCANMKSGRKK
jgi:hypothetical protein